METSSKTKNNHRGGRLTTFSVVVGADSGSGSERDETSVTEPAVTSSVVGAVTETKKKKTLKELRLEGGPFTFNTPIGALNPFAIYYGVLSLALGLPWFIFLKSCQVLYFVSRGRVDPKVGRRTTGSIFMNTSFAIISH